MKILRSLFARHELLVFSLSAMIGIYGSETRAQEKLISTDAFEKKVFAHYVGWYGDSLTHGGDSLRHWKCGHAHNPIIGLYDSRHQSLLTYHILLARACGIDGFVFNWYGQSSFENQSLTEMLSTINMLRSLDSSQFHFSFAVSYDDKASGSLDNNFVFLRDSVITQSSQYLYQDDKPVIFVFNYDGYWDAADYRRVGDSVFSSGPFLVWNESQQEALGFVDACYPWVQPGDTNKDGNLDWDSGGANWGKDYLNDFYWRVNNVPGHEDLSFASGGVWPGFDDRDNTCWGQNRWIDRRNGVVYDSTWEMALNYAGTLSLRWIYIQTANDFNEGSEIEPTNEDSSKYLQATIDYINRFKNVSIVKNDSIFSVAESIYIADRLIETGKRDSAVFYPMLKAGIIHYMNNEFARANELVVSIIMDTIITTGDQSVPVQATGFEAESRAGSVTLSWQTQSEVGNMGFNVLRENPGSWSFKLVGSYKTNESLKGLGTSTFGRKYSFIDNSVASGATYSYKIQSVSSNGATKDLATLSVTVEVPKEYALYQDYPNPSNPSTTIEFSLAEDGKVSLKVYNTLGQEVATLVDQELKAGVLHHATFNSAGFSSGVYFYRLQAGSYRETKKLVLLK